jgi:hypothetical protein
MISKRFHPPFQPNRRFSPGKDQRFSNIGRRLGHRMNCGSIAPIADQVRLSRYHVRRSISMTWRCSSPTRGTSSPARAGTTVTTTNQT